MKIQNLKLVIMLEYQNRKIFLQQFMFQIGLRKFLLLKKIQTLPWAYVINFNREEIAGRFYKRNYQKKKKQISSLEFQGN